MNKKKILEKVPFTDGSELRSPLNESGNFFSKSTDRNAFSPGRILEKDISIQFSSIETKFCNNCCATKTQRPPSARQLSILQ